jgi:hypothetical protein
VRRREIGRLGTNPNGKTLRSGCGTPCSKGGYIVIFDKFDSVGQNLSTRQTSPTDHHIQPPKCWPLNRRAFPMTDTELSDIARAATTGLSNIPKVGYRTPAATGIPITL